MRNSLNGKLLIIFGIMFIFFWVNISTASMRLPNDWRFKPSFIRDWRFQDSTEVIVTAPAIARILDNGEIARILDNGEIWKIFHYQGIEEKNGYIRFERADGSIEQINLF